MKANKILLSAFLLVSAIQFSLAQAPSRYCFFKGDSLNGFDVTACYTDALRFAQLNGLNDLEKLLYIRGKESVFIEQKYGLPAALRKPVGVPPAITSACNNLGFESGDFSGWTGGVGYNFSSTTALTVTSPVITTHGIDYPEPECAYHTLVDAAAGKDRFGLFPMLDSLGGTYALRLGHWQDDRSPVLFRRRDDSANLRGNNHQ
jgi:hypothetical protein